jgi:hypothetical protein
MPATEPLGRARLTGARFRCVPDTFAMQAGRRRLLHTRQLWFGCAATAEGRPHQHGGQ